MHEGKRADQQLLEGAGEEPEDIGHDGSRRRVALVVAAAGAGVLLLAGVSFGCLPWKGKIIVDTPDQDPTGTFSQRDVTVHGDGGDNDPATPADNLKWCDGTEPYAPAEITVGQTFTIEVDGKSDCGYKLDAGTYNVTWLEQAFVDVNVDGRYSDSEVLLYCHDDGDHIPPPPGVHNVAASELLGTIDVNGGGHGGPTQFTAPSQPIEAGAICLTHEDENDLQGNMVPIAQPIL